MDKRLLLYFGIKLKHEAFSFGSAALDQLQDHDALEAQLYDEGERGIYALGESTVSGCRTSRTCALKNSLKFTVVIPV